jgi:hypothetical protein
MTDRALEADMSFARRNISRDEQCCKPGFDHLAKDRLNILGRGRLS